MIITFQILISFTVNMENVFQQEASLNIKRTTEAIKLIIVILIVISL